MKTLMSLFVILGISLAAATTLGAQNVWKGGTPGQEQEWNNPRNWSQNRAPDINDIVLIPNTEARGGFYPVISEDAGPIYYLEVHGGATLTIAPTGSLTIDGIGNYEDAALLVGTLYNRGEIRISEGGGQHFAGHPENLLNTGKITAVSGPRKP
ncbi:MAG: hypothetical protein J5I94_22820 [Phaeodactylibacter sp.]|nr:hypothetical protein [Phaeodactylibacter sp.]